MSRTDDDYIWPAVGVAVAGLAAALAWYGPGSIRGLARKLVPEAPLSRRRERLLQLVSERVPRAEWKPNPTERPAGYTSCGELPRDVWAALGRPDGLTRGGLEQARIVGRAEGSWIEPGEGRRPRPGDVYGVSSEPGGIITHIGIVVDASGPTWRTADAGQEARDAPMSRTAYVERRYDARSNTLAGPSGARTLAGWIDADRVPVPQERIV